MISVNLKRLIVILFVTLTLTGCDPERGGSGGKPETLAPHTQPVPKPNPDTKPLPKRTPQPIAGDPQAGSEHTYALAVTWAPAAEFVRIEWTVGSKADDVPERSRGNWYKAGSVYAPADIDVQAQWTEISYRSLGNKNNTGQIVCIISIDGKIVDTQSTPMSGRPRGVLCEAEVR